MPSLSEGREASDGCGDSFVSETILRISVESSMALMNLSMESIDQLACVTASHFARLLPRVSVTRRSSEREQARKLYSEFVVSIALHV